MIQAREFVEAARRRGFAWYAGVPCSFLTPFINYVIADRSLTYLSASNEGDALAAAAGATIGGQRGVVLMQNSGLGNAVSPLTSLAHIFRIPLLLICTLRGDPAFPDEPQHALMGPITGRLLDTMQVSWEFFPAQSAAIEPALERAEAFFSTERRPYALVMRKGTVAPQDLDGGTTRRRTYEAARQEYFAPDGVPVRPSRYEALERIVKLTDELHTVVIATTGFTGRELFALQDRANHLYVVGSMGCASSLGLGLSLARPDLRVIVVDGDGAALMRMGNFASLGAYGGNNLIHIVLDNESHESTGGQGTVSVGVSFAGVAEACGYSMVCEGDDLRLVDALLTSSSSDGPRFGHLKIRPGTIANLPRPSMSPQQTVNRLMHHIGSHF